MTAFVTVFTVALLGVAGLVFDGGLLLAAHHRAFNEAEAAARAGAQAVDVDALRAGAGVRLDPFEAERRALDYLDSIDRDGTVEVSGDTVRVRLAFRQHLTILRVFGLGARTVDGEGVARAVSGVTEGET
ncbi:MAG: pilus assembly protein TadG-related protein [Acidimicrobiia bacterium]